MGKSNRIKQQKEVKNARSLNDYSKTKKKSMPNWAINLITIVITVAILLSVAVFALSSSGLVMRMRTAMASENYSVSGNMMKYYFQTTYQNFASKNESYMTYLSLNTEKPLKSQTIGDTTVNANALDTAIVGSEYAGKTWYDYFMDQTQKEVRNMLYYCEEATKRNISLDETDKANIDASIDSIRASAEIYGYTLNSYIANAYGKGISEKDVREAMELSSLSSKAMTAVAEELDVKITDDRIEAKYNENKKKFDLIDYSYYTFRITYTDIEKEVKAANANATEADILEAYKKAIAETKEKAEELLKKTDPVEFEKHYLEYVANDEFEEEFSLASDDKTEGKPDEANFEKIRKSMVEALVKEIMEDKDACDAASVNTDDKYTVYGVEVNKEWANIFDVTKYSLFDILKVNQDTSKNDGASFNEHDDFSVWAFDPARKAGELHKIYTGDGSKENAEITASDKYFYASVYILRKTQYIDDAKSSNLEYMFFSSEDAAKAAIEKLKTNSSVTEAIFDSVAHELSAPSHSNYENYVKGDLGSNALDKWLDKDSTVPGSFTDTPIKLDDSTYGVFFYASEGKEAWRVNVQSTLLEEDFDAFTLTMDTTYGSTIKVNAKVCSKVAN